jgi:hypothetical protein
MIIPAAMNLESAADMLKDVPKWVRDDQQKELSSFGDARAQRLGATGLSDDFRKGYEFGLQTARALVAQSAELILKGADPQNVL